MKKTGLLVVGIVILAIMLAACGGKAPEQSSAAPETSAEASAAPEAADTSLEDVKAKGKFIMGLDDSFPPMGYRDEKDELVGFDIDLAKEVAKRMDLEVQFQPINWDNKFIELDSGNIDCIWNGMTLDDERKEKMSCSAPYMLNEQIIIVNADSPIKTKADLAGKNVALQSGSSAVSALEKDTELKDSLNQVVEFSDNVKALLDLQNGQVDAVVVDSVVGDYYLNQQAGKFVVLEETLANEEFGIGFRKADIALRDAIEAVLDEMRADGTFAEISNQWFGRDVSATH